MNDSSHWVREVVGTFFFRLLLAELMFLLFALPIITIPASFCSLNAVILQFKNNGHGDVIPIFMDEFRTHLTQKILIPAALLITAGLPVMILGADNVPGLVGSSFLFLAACIVITWYCVQISYLSIDSKDALRNALIFFISETGLAFLMILITCMSMILLFCMWPVSTLAASFVLPLMIAFANLKITLPIINKLIVKV